MKKEIKSLNSKLSTALNFDPLMDFITKQFLLYNQEMENKLSTKVDKEGGGGSGGGLSMKMVEELLVKTQQEMQELKYEFFNHSNYVTKEFLSQTLQTKVRGTPLSFISLSIIYPSFCSLLNPHLIPLVLSSLLFSSLPLTLLSLVPSMIPPPTPLPSPCPVPPPILDG